MTTAVLDQPSDVASDTHLLAGADIVLADPATPVDDLVRAIEGCPFVIGAVSTGTTTTVRFVSDLRIGWSNVADLQRRVSAVADVVSVTRVRRMDLQAVMEVAA
jgi:hypothetical protein